MATVPKSVAALNKVDVSSCRTCHAFIAHVIVKGDSPAEAEACLNRRLADWFGEAMRPVENYGFPQGSLLLYRVEDPNARQAAAE